MNRQLPLNTVIKYKLLTGILYREIRSSNQDMLQRYAEELLVKQNLTLCSKLFVEMFQQFTNISSVIVVHMIYVN